MRDTVKTGDSFKGLKMFEVINECFGTNYKGWVKPWYDINEEYAAWFPVITSDGSNMLAVDGASILEVDPDCPTEKAKEEILSPKQQKFWKKRLVFGKIDGEFVFLGVFSREWLKDEEFNTQLHHRTARGIDLKTWQTFDSAYRVFVCPEAESEDTGRYKFIAEFDELKRALKYAKLMRGKKKFAKKDIIIKEVAAMPRNAEEGTIECLITTNGEKV